MTTIYRVFANYADAENGCEGFATEYIGTSLNKAMRAYRRLRMEYGDDNSYINSCDFTSDELRENGGDYDDYCDLSFRRNGIRRVGTERI